MYKYIYIFLTKNIISSEIQFLVYSDIQDVTVKKMHRKRGWLWLAAIVLLSVISALIFVFIPSHRL